MSCVGDSVNQRSRSESNAKVTFPIPAGSTCVVPFTSVQPRRGTYCARVAVAIQVGYAGSSSLPFRSLPLRLRLRSSLAIERFLLGRPQHRLVQYTYLPQVPFDLRNAGLRWRRIEWIWRNVPPACVWELRADGDAGSAPVSPE